MTITLTMKMVMSMTLKMSMVVVMVILAHIINKSEFSLEISSGNALQVYGQSSALHMLTVRRGLGLAFKSPVLRVISSTTELGCSISVICV